MIELYIKLDLSLYLNFPLYDLKIGQKVELKFSPTEEENGAPVPTFKPV